MREIDVSNVNVSVWRHGDRAPVGTYPTDIHQESAWPNGWGELTEMGMRQQYALGKVLRKRYIDIEEPFINKQYNSKQVYIRSTDVNRTLVSAYANLAGMFRSGEAGKDYPAQKWLTKIYDFLPGILTISKREDWNESRFVKLVFN
ncbi:hypothetical protein DICVIV_06209 [Dictyocaulus viviparus]|uniref:Histidine acid phosphatase n=1 Tax=Dictyocaulus viviparus TaxID=29172 RepID=A0A0D8XT54_DICVI|nr:hypothetical protein DICVIV_06209 [Dictyocaulus viviparus]